MKKKKKKTKLQKSKDNPISRYWRNKADQLWSKLVRQRDGNKCVICGNKDKLNAHHLIDRSVKVLRHMLINGLSLCPSCHKFNRRRSAHGGNIPFVLWMLERADENKQVVWVKENYGCIDKGYNYEAAYKKLKRKAG